ETGGGAGTGSGDSASERERGVRLNKRSHACVDFQPRGLKVASDCADNTECTTSSESLLSRHPPRPRCSQAPSGQGEDSLWRKSPCRGLRPSRLPCRGCLARRPSCCPCCWLRAVPPGTRVGPFRQKLPRPAWPRGF